MRSLLVVVVLCLTACSAPSWFRRAKAVIKTPTTTLTQVGDVAVPSNVTTTTTKTEAPIPPGSTITISTPPPTPGDYGRSPLPVLTQSVHTEQIVAPTSFTPPAGPTLTEQGDANLRIWCWAGVLIGGICALFGLVRGWNLVMLGGACVTTACLIALFIHAYPWLFILIGLGVGLKFAGPYIWHTQLKPTLPNVPPTT